MKIFVLKFCLRLFEFWRYKAKISKNASKKFTNFSNHNITTDENFKTKKKYDANFKKNDNKNDKDISFIDINEIESNDFRIRFYKRWMSYFEKFYTNFERVH